MTLIAASRKAIMPKHHWRCVHVLVGFWRETTTQTLRWASGRSSAAIQSQDSPSYSSRVPSRWSCPLKYTLGKLGKVDLEHQFGWMDGWMDGGVALASPPMIQTHLQALSCSPR